MVLSKENCGKYLTKEWHDPDRERQQCLYDSRNFSTTDQAYYEVGNKGIDDGKGYQIDNALGSLKTSPMDPNKAEIKEYDHRDKPEVGR